MREIIHLQIGGCGNQVGSAFWASANEEHGLDQSGTYIGDSDLCLERISVCYDENKNHFYSPRVVLIDSDPHTIDNISAGPLGKCFLSENIAVGHGSASNIWANGHFTVGPALLEATRDIIRKQSEQCDSFQGFQLYHSLGGGTGSGIGSLLIADLKEQFSDRLVSAISVFPNINVSDIVVEPYNSGLTLHYLTEFSDMSVVISNDSLQRIYESAVDLNQENALTHRTVGDGSLNILSTQCISGATCSLRFPAELNNSLRKFATNLVPFPRLHFLVTSVAPLMTGADMYTRGLSASELEQEMYRKNNMMSACDLKTGRILSGCALFRGNLSSKEVDETVMNVANKNSSFFVEWIANNIKSSLCPVPPIGLARSVTMVGNSTSLKDLFKQIKEQFAVMYAAKSYLHWYTMEGMEALEFEDSEANLNDLIDEYIMCQDMTTDDEIYLEEDDSFEFETETSEVDLCLPTGLLQANLRG